MSTCATNDQSHSTNVPTEPPEDERLSSSPNSPYIAQNGRKNEPVGDHAPEPSDGISPSMAEQKPPAAMAKKSSQIAICAASEVRMTVRTPSERHTVR